MPTVQEVYVPDLRTVELRPFIDRVLEIVRLFHDTPMVRLRVIGTIAAGEPIEAIEGPDEYVDVQAPDTALRHHAAYHALRRYLCPSLLS